MEKTGAAQLIADSVVGLVGGFGALAVIAAVFVLTSAASQVMPSAASALLLAPIAIHAAEDQGVSALTLAMTVAVAASASFLSPVGHPANVLVMGPGGYRFADYLRVGLPLTLVVLVVALIVLPIAWPLYPAGP
jgi:di/tricarboxylate transporter